MVKFVIFEGCDGSGKTTLYQAFRRASAYQILCIDRFIGSQLVYDEIYQREDKTKLWKAEELKFQELYDAYLVVLTAPLDVLLERIEKKETGKDLVLARRNCETADRLFRIYHEKTGFKKKILIESSGSQEASLKSLLDFVGEKVLKDPIRERMSS